MLDRESNQKKAVVFKQLITKCPLCQKSVKGHSIALLASVILPIEESGRRANQVNQLISNRQWTEVARIKEGRQDADMLQYHLLRCPDRGMVLLNFVFTFELWSDDWLDSFVILQYEDILELDRLVDEEWLGL